MSTERKMFQWVEKGCTGNKWDGIRYIHSSHLFALEIGRYY